GVLQAANLDLDFRNIAPGHSAAARLAINCSAARSRIFRATSVLLISGQLSTPPLVRTCTVLRSPPMTPLAGDTSLATIQSAPFDFNFFLAYASTSCVSAAKPMTIGGRFFVSCAIVLRMSGFSVRVRAGGPPADDFLILLALGAVTPVGDRSCKYCDIGGQCRLHGFKHFRGGDDTDNADADAAGICKRDGSRDECHAGAEAGGSDSEFLPLLPR